MLGGREEGEEREGTNWEKERKGTNLERRSSWNEGDAGRQQEPLSNASANKILQNVNLDMAWIQVNE